MNAAGPGCGSAGGGDQEQGGQGGTTQSSPDVNPGHGQTGALFAGGVKTSCSLHTCMCILRITPSMCL